MPGTTECRSCGTTFNRAAQNYYDNLCPDCKAEQDGEEATWPTCALCGDRVDPDALTRTTVSNPGVRGGRERVACCPGCA